MNITSLLQSEVMKLWKLHLPCSPARFLLSDKLHPQTISCVATRARPFGISIEIVDVNSVSFEARDIGGIIFQYPDTEGSIRDFSYIISRAA